MHKLTQPLKWWGGKHYLASKIIALMPPHLHYVEPYAGGLAVLLERDPFDESLYSGKDCFKQGVSEVVNDIDGRLTNFWRVLQDKKAFVQFQRIVEVTPFSEVEWREAEGRDVPHKVPDVAAAVAFFIRCRQSRTGQFKDFAPLSRNRTRRRMSEQASAWLTCIEGLPAIHARLKRVVVLNQDALQVIRSQDEPETLFYLDPPYLHKTRASTDAYGQHEMSEADHRELLATIKRCRGKVILSGYPSPLYDEELKRWRRVDFRIDNKASGGKIKRTMTEAVWLKYS